MLGLFFKHSITILALSSLYCYKLVPRNLGLSYESIPFPISTSFVYMSLTNSHGLQIYWCVFHSYCMLLGVSFMCFGFIYFLILELEMKEQALFETCYIPVAEGRATRLAEIQNDQLNFCLAWICITSAYILWTKESQIES